MDEFRTERISSAVSGSRELLRLLQLPLFPSLLPLLVLAEAVVVADVIVAEAAAATGTAAAALGLES